ncbi:MAG: SIS domain-containing protein [Thermoprotei archaeon]|nr:MAG: SIS domain-containing protein [Thermoprotei archaeon]
MLVLERQATLSYWNAISRIIEHVISEELPNILQAAELIAQTVEKGHYIYVFGVGHSSIVCKEMFHRAGGLVPVIPMCDFNTLGLDRVRRAIEIQWVIGYGRYLLKVYDVERGSVTIVVSNTGVSPLPLEVAIGAKDRGSSVIAITSVSCSRKLEPRNPWRKRLFEVADVAIDNKVPAGDAVAELGRRVKAGPVSTLVNVFIVNTIALEALKILEKRGVEPPVWMSIANPGGEEYNAEMLKRFPKLKLLF